VRSAGSARAGLGWVAGLAPCRGLGVSGAGRFRGGPFPGGCGPPGLPFRGGCVGGPGPGAPGCGVLERTFTARSPVHVCLPSLRAANMRHSPEPHTPAPPAPPSRCRPAVRFGSGRRPGLSCTPPGAVGLGRPGQPHLLFALPGAVRLGRAGMALSAASACCNFSGRCNLSGRNGNLHGHSRRPHHSVRNQRPCRGLRHGGRRARWTRRRPQATPLPRRTPPLRAAAEISAVIAVGPITVSATGGHAEGLDMGAQARWCRRARRRPQLAVSLWGTAGVGCGRRRRSRAARA
jgi:hypothetical protein